MDNNSRIMKELKELQEASRNVSHTVQLPYDRPEKSRDCNRWVSLFDLRAQEAKWDWICDFRIRLLMILARLSCGWFQTRTNTNSFVGHMMASNSFYCSWRHAPVVWSEIIFMQQSSLSRAWLWLYLGTFGLSAELQATEALMQRLLFTVFALVGGPTIIDFKVLLLQGILTNMTPSILLTCRLKDRRLCKQILLVTTSNTGREPFSAR